MVISLLLHYPIFMKISRLTTLGAFFLLLATTPGLAETGPIGKIAFITGSAESSFSGGTLANLSEGSPVFSGSKIITHENTAVRILLTDKIAMQLGPNTEITLTHPAVRDTRVSLKQGNLMSSVHPLGKRPRFEVRTRSASMGVRGTTFFVSESPTKPTFVCICHGTVAVKTQDGETPITSEHHDLPKFVDSKNGKLIAAQVGIDHKDEDAAALQKLVE